MTRHSLSRLILLGVLMQPVPYLLAESDTMDKHFANSAGDGKFLPLSENAATHLENLFVRTLSQPPTATDWQTAGFHLLILAPDLFAMQEQINQGRGFYLHRSGSGPAVFLQAPHRFYDRHSGEIVLRLFKQGNFRGAAWNTLHRKHASAPAGLSSDFAHMDHSPFTAQARAIARVHPEAIIIQIHGFSQGRRRTVAGGTADIVVSAGVRLPSTLSIRITDCLQNASLGTVRLYGKEIRELGGTTNVTSRSLRSMGFSGFIHLELSAQLRQRLLDDAAALARLARCLSPT